MVMNFLAINPNQKATLNRLMNMSYPELENFANNYFKERGIDLNKALEQIKRMG